MILHIHKKFTDALNLNKVANEFASQNSSLQTMFGKFNNLLQVIVIEKIMNSKIHSYCSSSKAILDSMPSHR